MGRYTDTLKLKKRLAAIEAALDIDDDSDTSLADAIDTDGSITAWADGRYEPKSGG